MSEITQTMRITLNNGEMKKTIDYGTTNITQTAQGLSSGIVIVGTSEEDLVTSDISTLGLTTIHNLDTTNYVTYGPKSGGAMIPFGRIKPDETAHLRLEPGITWRWQANTAPVKVAVDVFEN